MIELENFDSSQYVTPINVKVFGAKGDGITDDTEAIQSCLNIAKLTPLRKVIFPSGKYIVSSTLNVVGTGVTIEGVSGYKSQNVGGYQPAITEIMSTFINAPVFQIGGDSAEHSVTDCALKNIGVRPNINFSAPFVYDVNGCGVKVVKESRITIEGVYVSGFYTGIAMLGSIYSRVNRCEVTNAMVAYEVGGISGYSESNVVLLNECIAKFSNIGFLLNGGTNLSLLRCSAEVISDQYAGYVGIFQQGCAIVQRNIKVLNVDTFYVEGADCFVSSSNTLPSTSARMSSLYFNNHQNYVVNGLKRNFGNINIGMKIDGLYVLNNTAGSNVGRIEIKDRCQVQNVTGGHVVFAGTDIATTLFATNNFSSAIE